METLNSARNFVMNNQRTILIAVGVAVVLFLAYRYMYPSNEFPEMAPYPGVESFYQGNPMMDSEQTQAQYDLQNRGMLDPRGATASVSNLANKAKKKIMLFFAVWCPHCKDLTKPDGVWNQLKHKYGNREDVEIDSVDCEEKPEMATKYGVGGFPTIKMFDGDRTIDYDGDRTLASLERFIDSA